MYNAAGWDDALKSTQNEHNCNPYDESIYEGEILKVRKIPIF